jgi:hypothetical protein
VRRGERAGGRSEDRPKRTVFSAVPQQEQQGPNEDLERIASIRLVRALDRLDPASRRDAAAALVPLARSLDPDEEVHALVQGWAKGLLCVVARTDDRIVIVVDRFPKPLVESLDPRTTRVEVRGPAAPERVSISVIDGQRLLEVTGVRDPEQARLLAATRAHQPR